MIVRTARIEIASSSNRDLTTAMNHLLSIVAIILNLYYSHVSAGSSAQYYTKAESKRKYGSGYGFGGDARGGEFGETIEVKTKGDLIRALCNTVKNGVCLDSFPRTILLGEEIDFSLDGGIVTEPGCENDAVKHPECTSINRHILNRYGSCSGKPMTQVSYAHAGVSPLLIGSNKTLKGGGTIVGTGILFRGVSNVFVSNIFIESINPKVAFGGSAFTIESSQQVFIDNCTVERTGIMVETKGRGNTFTVSNSHYYGDDEYIPSCGDYHFFLWLVDSNNDQITFYKNKIYNAYGSGFSTTNSNSLLLHLICNAFNNMSMESLTYNQGNAIILAEGNVFKQVLNASMPFKGSIYLPRLPPDSKRCKTLIDRICLLNDISAAQCYGGCRTDDGVLEAFKKIERTLLAAF